MKVALLCIMESRLRSQLCPALPLSCEYLDTYSVLSKTPDHSAKKDRSTLKARTAGQSDENMELLSVLP